MPDIFISYSRKDLDFGKKLHQSFTAKQKDIWMDWEDIPLTADWWTEIRRGIESSDNFLLVMSPDSIGSPVCQLEIEHARSLHKRIVPIFHRDPQFEQSTTAVIERVQKDEHLRRMMAGRDAAQLMEDNKKVLATLNWVFFRPEDDFDEKFRQLAQIVDADLVHIRQHTKLQVEALEWQESSKNISFVISGDELKAAETWLVASADKQPPPTDLHREYIAASQRVENARRRLLRGLQIASVVTTLLIVIALIATLAATNQANEANLRADYALTQVAAASTAQQDSVIQAATAQRQAGLAETARIQSAEEAAAAQTYAAIALTEQSAAELKAAAAETHVALAATARIQSAEEAAAAQTYAAIALTEQHQSELNAAEAQTQVAVAATAQRKAEQSADDSATQVMAFGAALTPIPPTLTAVAAKIEVGEDYAAAMRLSGEAIAMIQDESVDARTAALLAIRSLGYQYTGLADNTLLAAIDRFFLIRTFGEDFPVAILDAAFLPNGRLVTAGNGIYVWDTSTGQLVATLIEAGDDLFGSMALSPDGKLLITFTATEPGPAIYMWRLEGSEARPLSFNLPVNGDRVGDALFGPDGAPYLLLNPFEQCRLWNPVNGQTHDYPDGCVDAIFSPDGDLVAIQGLEALTVRRAGGGQTVLTIPLVNMAVGQDEQRFVFSPDNSRIAVANQNQVQVWDIGAGRQVLTLAGHTDQVTTLAFTPDGHSLITGSADGTLRLWNAEDGQLWRTLPGGGPFTRIAVSPDGEGLVSADQSTAQPARLWSLQADLPRQFVVGDSPVSSLAFSSDGRALLMGSNEALMAYDIATETVSREQRSHGASPVFVLQTAWQPEGNLVAMMAEATLSLLDITTGQQWQLAGYSNEQYGTLLFTPDGRRLITVSVYGNGPIVVWDVASRRVWQQWPQSGSSTELVPRHSAVSPDNQTLMVSDYQGILALDITTGETRSAPAALAAGSPLAYSPDGRWLAGMLSDETAAIGIFDASGGAVVVAGQEQLRTPDAMAFSPDSRLLALAYNDRTIQVLDVATGRIVRVLNGANPFTVVAFSPDGLWLAGGSKGGEVRLWNVNYTDTLAYACERLGGYDFSADERLRYQLDDTPTCPG